MGDHQRIVFFPPGEIPAFAAEEAYHLQQVINLGRPQGRLKGRHDPASLSDEFPNLIVAFSLHGFPKVRRLHWQVNSGWTVTAAAGTMATIATLRIKRVHPLIAPASAPSIKRVNGNSQNSIRVTPSSRTTGRSRCQVIRPQMFDTELIFVLRDRIGDDYASLSRFGVSLEEDLLAAFDLSIGGMGYQNRSEAIRDLIRDHLIQKKVGQSDTEVIGVVTLVI